MKTEPTEPKPNIIIADADQLQKLCDAPVTCYIKLDRGATIEIPCRRLDGQTQELVREIQRSAKPKWDPVRKDYDLFDEKYLKERDHNLYVARAVTIYWGCPLVAAKKPGLQDREQICQFVQGLFTENILQALELTVQGGGLELVDGANFTSTPGSES